MMKTEEGQATMCAACPWANFGEIFAESLRVSITQMKKRPLGLLPLSEPPAPISELQRMKKTACSGEQSRIDEVQPNLDAVEPRPDAIEPLGLKVDAPVEQRDLLLDQGEPALHLAHVGAQVGEVRPDRAEKLQDKVVGGLGHAEQHGTGCPVGQGLEIWPGPVTLKLSPDEPAPEPPSGT